MNDSYDKNLTTGAKIAQYVIRDVLGIGGFGITYKAWDDTLQRWVAIKEFLPADLAVRDGATATVKAHTDRIEDYRYALEKFLEEARTLARFNHPNIVQVLNFFEANGTGYLVMAYEEGQSLSQYLKVNPGPLPEAQLKKWVIPILTGLVEVHSIGFLHRDIKPGNIYLRSKGEPLLIDFGAARQAIGEHSRSVTGIVSAGYAPNEQYGTDAKKQGPWTDLYSVGASMYRCITGNDPVDAPTRQSAVMEGDADPLTTAVEVGRGVYSASLLQLVDQLLVLPIKQRPQTAQAVLETLQQGRALANAGNDPRSTVVTRVVDKPVGLGIPATPRPVVTPPPAGGARKTGVAAIVVIALLLVGAGYWGVSQYGSGPVVVEPPSAFAVVTPEPVPAADDKPAAITPEPTPPALTREELLSGQSIAVITSEPGGAEVALDGVAIGSTPFRHQTLRPGDYTLTLSQPYSKPYSEQITLSPNRVYSHAVTLEVATGDLTVLSEPSGARIELDGKQLGQTTPATIEGLSSGPHRIVVSKGRYTASEREVTVLVDEVARDMHQLQPIQYGQLTLDLTPKVAKVTLLDIEPVYSPGMELPMGIYRVQVSAPKHEGWSGEVRITEAPTTKAVKLTYIPTLSEQVGKEFRDTLKGGGEGPEMVVLPTGRFRMGNPNSIGYSDEKPAHDVTIRHPFAMMKYEVTFAEYDRYAESTGKSKPSDEGWGRGARPVINVSWENALDYVQWLSDQTGKRYRLPTEAEWEYAARAGSSTKYSWGDRIDCGKARYGFSSGKCGKQRSTAEIGSYPENSWKLADLHGNVSEWVADCWHSNYVGASPYGSEASVNRNCRESTFRGGSWADKSEDLRSATRERMPTSLPHSTIGFRLVQDLDT